jgi:hypothetical protein
MATIKNIPDTYDIYVPTMTIHGNLNVTGNTTNINSTTIDVDNTLIFNGNLTGSTRLDALIEVNRPSAANVTLRWSESNTAWQITNDGTHFGNLVYAPNGNVTLTANLYLTNTSIAPVAVTGTAVLYASTPNFGGSGLYVTNSAYSQEELALKRRAIAYSIIFGS